MRKICISVFAGIEYEELLPKVKKLGFDGIFIKDDYSFDSEKLKWAKSTADSLGLFTETLHSTISGCKTIWSNGNEGDNYIDVLKQNILNCEKFSIPILIVHIHPDFDKNPVFETGLKRLKIIVDYAKEHNIKIAFENMNSAEFLYQTLKAFDDSHVGFCYDSGHEFCYTKGERFLPKIGGRLFCTHLHDNKGKTDKHQIPFDGKIDFNETIKELHECNYSGNLTFELCYTHRYQNLYPVDEFLKRSYEGALKFRELFLKNENN